MEDLEMIEYQIRWISFDDNDRERLKTETVMAKRYSPPNDKYPDTHDFFVNSEIVVSFSKDRVVWVKAGPTDE